MKILLVLALAMATSAFGAPVTNEPPPDEPPPVVSDDPPAPDPGFISSCSPFCETAPLLSEPPVPILLAPDPELTESPEPATSVLLGVGLIGLSLVRRKRPA